MTINKAEVTKITNTLTKFQERVLPLKVKGKNAGQPKWLVVPIKSYKGLLLVLTETKYLMFQIKGFGQFQGINIKDLSSLANLKSLLNAEVYEYMKVRLEIMSNLNGTNSENVNTSEVDL